MGASSVAQACKHNAAVDLVAWKASYPVIFIIEVWARAGLYCARQA